MFRITILAPVLALAMAAAASGTAHAQDLQLRVAGAIAGTERAASHVVDQAAPLPAAARQAALAARINGGGAPSPTRPSAPATRNADTQLALAVIITGAKGAEHGSASR